MNTPTLASLLLLAACSTHARTTVTTTPPSNVAPVASYTLITRTLSGNEGRHSSSHSSTTMSGALRISGDTAELDLVLDRHTSPVWCPEDIRTGRAYSMQQCASPDAKPTRTVDERLMRGTVRTENGVMHLSLESPPPEPRYVPTRLELACRDTFLGLACEIGETTLFSFGYWPRPTTIGFMGQTGKRFAIAPVQVKNIGEVSGSVEIGSDAKVEVTLALDGGEPATLPGSVTWADHALLVGAQTSPTRQVGAICTLDGDRMSCEVTADRSVLGTTDHLHVNAELSPAHDVAPAIPPMGATAMSGR